MKTLGRFALLSLLMACLLSVPSQLSGASSNHAYSARVSEGEDYWRRTANGWEWLPPSSRAGPRPLTLHPLTLAAFECLASVWVLMLAERRR